MFLNRRKLLTSAAALGAATLLPGFAQAEEESIWDQLARNARKKDVKTDENTFSALQTIDTPEPILSFDTAYSIQLAIAYYQQVVAAGGWEEPTRQTFNLSNGKDGKAVSNLKRHLMLVGDYPQSDRINGNFDGAMDLAVRKFQVRHGIVPTGKIDEPTFYALAVPAEQRLAQLMLNAARVESLAGSLQERYLLVNIPAASIETVQGGMVNSRHNAVVGKIDRQTPLMSSKVHQVKFNPYWTVPKSIIEKDLIRYMNDDPNYLTNFNIRIFDGNGNELPPTAIDWSTNDAVKYTFRQDPGGENSMGHVKIDFYNPYDCYLHDTPAKALFGENQRFHSSGCVRVDGVDTVVNWLLQDNGGWDIDGIHAMFATNENVNVPLTFQMPIHTTYITAWSNRQGTVSFRDDVYGYDAQGKVTFDA
ncbi:MAG: murein L,D-transpeptidase [Hyphomicrobiales bacterium]|nr:MAG: murein L,D-transpeptidase [Hyphomicrobiales bacterium]